jgi:hypothetical protein
LVRIVLDYALVTLLRFWQPSVISPSPLFIVRGLLRLLLPDAILPLILVKPLPYSFPERSLSNNSQALHLPPWPVAKTKEGCYHGFTQTDSS